MEGANEKPTMILCHHFDEDLGIHIPVLKSVESWQPPEKSKKASDEAQHDMYELTRMPFDHEKAANPKVPKAKRQKIEHPHVKQ